VLHGSTLSIRWPASHQMMPSRLAIPRINVIDRGGDDRPPAVWVEPSSISVHFTRVSATHELLEPLPRGADGRAALVPANHMGAVSTTWRPNEHDANRSAYWLANHVGPVSRSWPETKFMSWPPSHTVDASVTWSSATPSWRLRRAVRERAAEERRGRLPTGGPLPNAFPEGHSLATSATWVGPPPPDDQEPAGPEPASTHNPTEAAADDS
jgi:hypothetical protein